MVINSNGNVGIGTTGPGVPLDVIGAIRTSTSLTTGAPTGGTAAAWKLGIYVATPTIPTGYIQVDIGGTLYEIPAKVH